MEHYTFKVPAGESSGSTRTNEGGRIEVPENCKMVQDEPQSPAVLSSGI